MTDKEKPPVIEGEIVDKTKPTEKTKGPSQFISERTVGLGFVVILLGVGGYYGYPYLSDWALSSPVEQPEVTTPAEVMSDPDLEGRVSALEVKVTGIERAPAEVFPSADLEARIAALETGLSQIPAEGGGPIVEDPRIARMAAELAVLKTTIENLNASQGAYSPGFAGALAALAPPLYNSGPFAGELEQVRIYILDMPAFDQATLSAPMAVLANYAGTGIVGMPRLREQFSSATLEALRTEGISPDAGWWDKAWAKIKGQVVIRRTDGVGASSLETVIIEAEDLLAEGNVQAAHDLIAALPSDQATAFNSWLVLAGERAVALGAFQVLTSYISSAASDTGSGR